MKWREYRSILLQAGKEWAGDGAPRLSASISFYAILSLAPMLVIALTILTTFLDSQTIRNSLQEETTSSLGKGASDLVMTLIEHASHPGTSIPATILAILISLYAASGLFGQIELSLEYIWRVKHEGSPFLRFLASRIQSIIMMLGFLLILLAWLSFDSILGWLARISGSFSGWPAISLLASTVFVTLVFALTFRAIPRGRVLWREVWPGAIFTGIGFSVAKLGLSMYFSYSGVAAAYGSAGAVVVVLLWVYYSAQIFFFGAEITKVVAQKRAPRPKHVRVTP
jgi:membrane protein